MNIVTYRLTLSTHVRFCAQEIDECLYCSKVGIRCSVYTERKDYVDKHEMGGK